MAFTPDEKLKSVERELGYRRFVFPKRVEAGSMTKAAADREIAIFEEIAADYRAEIDRGRLL